jgi:uncharacterized protein DUF5681
MESDEAPAEFRPQQAKGEYQVGYRRPPAEHQFKVGNNANPKGRKKKTRNRKLVVRDLLFEPVTVREGGEIRQISALEAVIKKTLSKALGGDHKAALTIIGLAQREALLTPEQDEALDILPESDLAIVNEYMRNLDESRSAQAASPAVKQLSPAEGRQPDAS